MKKSANTKALFVSPQDMNRTESEELSDLDFIIFYLPLAILKLLAKLTHPF